MKRPDVFISVRDILCILSLRLRLILKDRLTLLVLAVSLLIFIVIISSLSTAAEDYSSIPIGIADQDRSIESKALIRRVSALKAFRVEEGDEEKLNKLLLDDMIFAMFVIEEGYEEGLVKGRPEETIAVHIAAGDEASQAIADIIAGEMMYSVCLYKSINYYEGIRFDGSRLTEKAYKAYMDDLLRRSTDFDFAFDIVHEDPGAKGEQKLVPKNSLIYNQVISGIIGSMLSFLAMFIISQIVRERETGVNARLKVSKLSILKQDAGNFLAAAVTESLPAVIMSILICRKLYPGNALVFMSFFSLAILFACLQAALFLIISKCIASTAVYQTASSIMILAASGLGFFGLVNKIYVQLPGIPLKLIANNWFIRGFTDIILYGNSGRLFMTGHYMLLALASALLLIIAAYDLISLKAYSGRCRIL